MAQVVLRWLIQREVMAIPKSVRKDRIEENFDVFDFELTQGQMTAIAAMDTGTSIFLDHRDPDQVGRLGTGPTAEPASVLLDRPIQVGFGVSDRWAQSAHPLS